MPGPIIQGNNPMMDWANDQSVMDPLYETLMKKVISTGGDLIGANDPETAVTSLMNPMATPAFTIAKIPFENMTARNVMLLHNLQQRNAPAELIKAVEFAADKYPRVLAHVDDIDAVSDLGSKATMGAQMGLGDRFNRSVIAINPKAIKTYGKTGNTYRDTANTVGHELTHAAQSLWNNNSHPGVMKDMYDAAIKIGGGGTKGYRNNVFEEGATKAGANFARKLYGDVPEQPGVIDQVLSFFGLK